MLLPGPIQDGLWRCQSSQQLVIQVLEFHELGTQSQVVQGIALQDVSRELYIIYLFIYIVFG